MPEPQLDELESLVSAITEDRRRLLAENRDLQEEVQRLKETLSGLSGEGEDLRNRLKEMARLESRQKHLEDERQTLKTRVQSVLQELENTDFL